MSRPWTHRRTILPPPASGPRTARLCALFLLVVLLLPACGGGSKNENRIKPIQAVLNLQPFPGMPDAAVFLDKGQGGGDLAVVDVKLHNATGNPIDFDAFTLEFTYDFNLIQIGDVFSVNTALLGDCNAGTSCDPLCLNNAASANQGLTVDGNGKAHFLMGVAARPGCQTASVTSDTTLVSIGFIAGTTIPGPVPSNNPNNAPGRITLVQGGGAQSGDCEILQNVLAVQVNGQPIPCTDGSAYLTATN
jgi:hypothetical protein